MDEPGSVGAVGGGDWLCVTRAAKNRTDHGDEW